MAGTVFTITGTNFTAATSLTFTSTNGTRIAAPFTVNSASQLAATVPTNAVTGPLVLTTPGGVIYSAGAFTVLPRLDNFAPTLGPAGTAVVLQGQNFSSATAVRFNGTAAAFTINSPTQLTATVPAGATTGTLQVANADGTTTSTATFLVTRPSDLVITTSNAPPSSCKTSPRRFSSPSPIAVPRPSPASPCRTRCPQECSLSPRRRASVPTRSATED